MGNQLCTGPMLYNNRFRRGSRVIETSARFTLIWLDNEQKKNVELRSYLKQINRRVVKFENSDLCEGYIRRRPHNHFVLISCYRLGNILVPEIDDLPQLDSVFVYDLLPRDDYKSWMKQCQKVICDLFIDLQQLEKAVKERILHLQGNITDLNTSLTTNEQRTRSMSTYSARSTSSIIDVPYYLVWLDVDTYSDKDIKQILGSINAKCEFCIFRDVSACEEYVFIHPNDQFIFIISYDFGSKITPKIAFLKQTIAILLYLTSSKINIDESWIDPYLNKVHNLIIDLTKLENILRYELQKYGICKNESAIILDDSIIIMDVFNQKEMATRNLQSEKGNFLWFKLFVEVLINMKDNEKAQENLVEILKTAYSQSKFVNDFAVKYKSDEAIEWFTHDNSCLLQVLNRALRVQNLDHLFLFRCLIRDLYYALKNEHDRETANNSRTITFYRRQIISKTELQLLKTNVDQLIAINSFITAWDDRNKAINFQKSNFDLGLDSVLFEIEVDYRKKSSPFARINGKEDVVLFMLGCIFRIRSIISNDELDSSVLKLELCSDDDVDLKKIFEYMRANVLQPESNLITLGILLFRMNELDKAQQYFNLMLSQLEENDPNYAHCLDWLGELESDQRNPQKALFHHERALSLRQKYDLSDANLSLIIHSYINIANDQKDLMNYGKALEYLKQATTEIHRRNSPEDKEKIAHCYFINGSILYEQNNGWDAIQKFEDALSIYQELNMPEEHPTIASIYHTMGLCYLVIEWAEHYLSTALDRFLKAYELRRKILPHNHPKIGVTCRWIGLVYEKLKQHNDALNYFQKAFTIYKASNKTCKDLQDIEAELLRVQDICANLVSPTPLHFTKPTTSIDHSTDNKKLTSFNSISPSISVKQNHSTNSDHRLILLGQSYESKDIFGNVLLGRENLSKYNQDLLFRASNRTRSRKLGKRNLQNYLLYIIDTPTINKEQILTSTEKKEFVTSLELSLPVPHAFLAIFEYILDVPSSEIHDQQFVDSLIDIFGSKVFDSMVLVFTNIETLQSNNIGVETYMTKRLSKPIIDLKERCNDRIVSIYNNAPQTIKDCSLVELMQTIDRMHNENRNKLCSVIQSSWFNQPFKSLANKKTYSAKIDYVNYPEQSLFTGKTSSNYGIGGTLEMKGYKLESQFEKIDFQSKTIFTDHIFGISFQPYKYHVSFSYQDKKRDHPVYLKPLAKDPPKILIICFGINPLLVSSGFKYTVESFDDECFCIARLLSLTDTRIYFVISSKIGQLMIPHIHLHRCIEQIYVFRSNDNQRDTLWTNQFEKIRDSWSDFDILRRKVNDDIELSFIHMPLWPNSTLLDRCHTQTPNDVSRKSNITLNVVHAEKYSNLNKKLDINIVILHCDDHPLFNIDSQRFLLREFSNVLECTEYLETINQKSMLLIISGETHNVIHIMKKITILDQIFAVYLFVPSINLIYLDDCLRSYDNIGRLFDNLENLLTCLTADIKFYLEEPLYFPNLSVFDPNSYKKEKNKGKRTKDDEQFFSFQLFIRNFKEAPDSICRINNLQERCFHLVDRSSNDDHQIIEILKIANEKIYEWFIDVPILSVVLNSFLRESFPQNLFDIQIVLRNIDKHLINAPITETLFTLYRVQLCNQDDLSFLQTNINKLICLQTYIIATRSLLTARTIARQAADRGLSVVIYQIEIPIGSRVLNLDQTRVLFRFGSIFHLRSIDWAPDFVWYIRMKYADSNFDIIQQRLQIEIGIELSWLTLGNYFYALNQTNEAKYYFQYLENISLKIDRARSSIFNNIALFYTQLGDKEQALKYYNLAKDSINPTSSEKYCIQLTPTPKRALAIVTPSDKLEITFDRSRMFENMAEIYLHKTNHNKALEYYRKALESATDPIARVRLQQNIQEIHLLNK